MTGKADIRTVQVAGQVLRVAMMGPVDAERTLLTNQLTLSQDVNFQMSASIHLIQALGGGWIADAHR